MPAASAGIQVKELRPLTLSQPTSLYLPQNSPTEVIRGNESTQNPDRFFKFGTKLKCCYG